MKATDTSDACESDPQNPVCGMRIVFWLLLACPLLLACQRGSENAEGKPPSTNSQVAAVAVAEAAFADENLDRANDLVRDILIAEADNDRALLLAAKIAGRSGDVRQALELSKSAWRASNEQNHQALEFRANFAFEQKHLMSAVESMEQLVAKYPDNSDYRIQAGIINLTVGRETVAAGHARHALVNGRIEPSFLFFLCDTSRPFGNEAVCREAVETVPEDLRPLQSIADAAAYSRDWGRTAETVERILERHPDYPPAYLLLGRCLLEKARAEQRAEDTDEVEGWLADASEAVRQHADYWANFGRFLTNRGEDQSAARCFWQALKIDSSHTDAANRLATSLQRIGSTQQAAVVAQRAQWLNKLRENSERFHGWKQRSQSAACDIARNLKTLGRLPEARAWAMLAMQMPQDPDPDARAFISSILNSVPPNMPIQVPQLDVVNQVDLASIALPALDRVRDPNNAQVVDDDTAGIKGAKGLDAAELRFEDQAVQRGAQFRFVSGDDLDEPGMSSHQSNGGGVGVLDFDLNGYPDLYLSSAGGKPLLPTGGEPNALFRNVVGNFEDVAVKAGVDLTAYNSGIAVGDYNQDGFDDIYVAAIGSNRLLRNNGDGTFRDVTDDVGIELATEGEQLATEAEELPADQRWTSSVVMADLDGDGYVDLYDANYLSGRSTFERKCAGKQPGELRVCTPISFPAAKDRVLRGSASGEFVDVSLEWLSDVVPGRGLGVLAGNLDGTNGLDLFVANDMSANLYFHSVSSMHAEVKAQGPYSLIESAVVRGLAYDRYAAAQACMGIAAGDPTCDGQVDLLVTNFHDEANTLYRQVSPGIWEDVSRQVGIAGPTRELLGFGCHFVDFDNDGDLELFVTNGHIDDFTSEGQPFRMVPQILQQVGVDPGAQWRDVERSGLGSYFEAKHLGRSVAVLDVNRDGRQDLCISDLTEAAALLVNETQNVGTAIRLKLVATESHRDAIGTQVSWEAAGQRHYTQLFAGNGYQCSNERSVHLPVGEASKDRPIAVTVTWPGGSSQSYALSVGGDFLLTEGAKRPFAFRAD